MISIILFLIAIYIIKSNLNKKGSEKVHITTKDRLEQLDYNPDAHKKMTFDWRTKFDEQLAKKTPKTKDSIVYRPNYDTSSQTFFKNTENKEFGKLNNDVKRPHNPLVDIKHYMKYDGSNFNGPVKL